MTKTIKIILPFDALSSKISFDSDVATVIVDLLNHSIDRTDF